MVSQRIEYRNDANPASAAPHPRDVAAVASALQRGALVVLPTETVYGLTVLPGFGARLLEVKGRAESQVFTRHIASITAIEGPMNPRAARLARRFWPGPLTLVLDSPNGVSIGYRMPDHPFTAAVIDICGHDHLLMTSVNRTGSAPLSTAAEIEAEFGGEVEILVADDLAVQGAASTVVRCDGPRLELLRHGAIAAEEVFKAAADRIVFVCTGNTCRSPLAEVIARHQLAERLGVAANGLLARGFDVVSAGVAARAGAPASSGSVLVAREIGLDLTQHRSQPIRAELLSDARAIFCMSPSHADAIVDWLPETAGRIALLDEDGVPDPFGSDPDTYRETRDAILAAVTRRLDELLAS